MNRRIRAGWCSFNSSYDFFTNRLVPMKLKRKLFESTVEPVILYGCECWALKKKELDRLATGVRSMMRKMAGVTLLDRRTNDWLEGVVKLVDIRKKWARRKWNWARKIANMQPDRWTKKVTEWRPWERNRSRGRPKARWRDDFTATTGENWSRCAVQNPDMWRTVLTRHVEKILNS